MDNDLLFIVLKKCYEKGIGDSVNVSHEFKAFLRKDNMLDTMPVNWREMPNIFLGELKELGYIHYYTIWEVGNEIVEPPNNWFDVMTVFASIKPSGLLFYNSWNQAKIQEKANRISFWNVWLTLGLAVVTFCLALPKTISESLSIFVSKKTTTPIHQQEQKQKEEKTPKTKGNPPSLRVDSTRKP
ncbi:hypothetical protein [Mucilaginibacter pedocola]|uniref:Uncharacterized protein n=1 Tax=Mucilaginibacter pedocola TaxID=1792845 RepID=A0A1S9PIY2_9SPHI|nr:hypothetical protein [Mucilaginibacter pedocola]OOQ60906.1 hypothetical protein BC343_23380 [Mucilaginibacter pedocola]